MLTFFGKVIPGEGRGSKIGFPTANLDNVSLPLNHGVYLVEISFNKKIYKGLFHFGLKKTFNKQKSAEVYIDKFNSRIYGQRLKVKILKKIRKTARFKDAAALARQIKKDKESLR